MNTVFFRKAALVNDFGDMVLFNFCDTKQMWMLNCIDPDQRVRLDEVLTYDEPITIYFRMTQKNMAFLTVATKTNPLPTE